MKKRQLMALMLTGLMVLQAPVLAFGEGEDLEAAVAEEVVEVPEEEETLLLEEPEEAAEEEVVDAAEEEVQEVATEEDAFGLIEDEGVEEETLNASPTPSIVGNWCTEELNPHTDDVTLEYEIDDLDGLDINDIIATWYGPDGSVIDGYFYESYGAYFFDIDIVASIGATYHFTLKDINSVNTVLLDETYTFDASNYTPASERLNVSERVIYNEADQTITMIPIISGKTDGISYRWYDCEVSDSDTQHLNNNQAEWKMSLAEYLSHDYDLTITTNQNKTNANFDDLRSQMKNDGMASIQWQSEATLHAAATCVNGSWWYPYVGNYPYYEIYKEVYIPPVAQHNYTYAPAGNGQMIGTCTVCGANTTAQAVLALNAASAPLKTKQKTNVIGAISLHPGDYIVSWTSSNPKVATVAANGQITAGKKKGKAVITVTTAGGATSSVTINVQKSKVKAKKILGLQKNVTLRVGETLQLTPSVEPITVPDKAKYSSSKKKVASVSKQGLITAKKAGKAKITVKYGSKKFTIKVNVVK